MGYVILNKVIYMQVNGKMIKCKEMVIIYFKIVICMWVRYKKD